MIPLMGAFCHFTQKLPLPLVFLHVGTTTLVSLVLLTLQHFLSLMSSNQILPLLVGLIGSFLGLFSMFFPPAAARFVLWGYFSAFTPFGMDYDSRTRVMSFYKIPCGNLCAVYTVRPVFFRDLPDCLPKKGGVIYDSSVYQS